MRCEITEDRWARHVLGPTTTRRDFRAQCTTGAEIGRKHVVSKARRVRRSVCDERALFSFWPNQAAPAAGQSVVIGGDAAGYSAIGAKCEMPCGRNFDDRSA
jgi:hypothetical protein